MSISAILQKIRGKRLETARSQQDQYGDFVLRLSNGEQVDADELANIMDQLDIDDVTLERDVETKSERLRLAKQLAENRVIAEKMESLENELAIALGAMNDVVRKHQSKVDNLRAQLQAARTAADMVLSTEERLRSVCSDRLLVERENELRQRMKVIHNERLPLEQNHEEVTKQVCYHRANVERLKQQMGKAHSRVRFDLETKLVNHESALESRQNELDRLTNELKPLTDEMETVQRELSEIQRKKLIP